MRTMRILSLIVVAAIGGSLVGGAIGYVEIRNDLNPPNELPGEIEATAPDANGSLAAAEVAEPHYDFGRCSGGRRSRMSSSFAMWARPRLSCEPAPHRANARYRK